MNLSGSTGRTRTSFVPWIGPCAFVFGLLALVYCPAVAQAQNQRPSPLASSDLGRENMSRVAASAAEIKTVLLEDTGLLVELKRWVARDETDHGQIVSDSDLTNDAIFERLETEVQFRAVATRLVQRYGYLLPKRAKRDFQTTSSCDQRFGVDCNTPPVRPTPAEGRGLDSQPGGSSPRNAPGEPNSPDLPRGIGNPVERAQMIRTGEESSDLFPQLPFGDFDEPMPNFNALNASRATSSEIGDTSTGGQSAGLLTIGNVESRNTFDGVGAPGTSMGRASGMTPEAGRMNSPDLSSSAPSGASPVVSMQPSNSRYQPKTPAQPVEMVRTPNPYENVPSLYDMYVQAVPRPSVPRRFGVDVFENGSRNPQLIPMDLPAGPEYVVGPGDGLAIDLWGGVSQRFYRLVDREGRVSLPEIGPVLVSGKSLADVQRNLQQILRTQFRDVSADVSLARLRTIRVYEVGDVANPGAYDISSLSTPLNALFAAGGPTPRGSLRIVKHYRGNQLVQVVDLYDLLLHGVRTNIQRLENGDSVLVPPIGPQVTVEGMVRRPAIYELRDEKNLASILELAGGLLPTATLRHIEVQRILTHEKQTMLSLDIPEAVNDSEVTTKLESFEVRDGDRIRIYPIAPYNQDVVYLEGHAIRPGRYSYRDNMRVTDVIASYKDLLPEPATQYAEIIRLNAPDFHPTIESFALADALAIPEQAPLLRPLDTIRVFSRFDFENPPMVSVWGDVRTPGSYRTSGQIRLTDAVHLAGGLAPDAQTEDAQVFRYLPDGKFKIFSVSLSQALAGDPTENILLQPRDRLLIHRNPDAVEPATVYVQGEVGKPGRYPLTTNLTAADLIRVGGGLKPSADTQTADLTLYRWQNGAKLEGQHVALAIPAALAGDPEANVSLHNGDILTIRQLPGWNDLGASIVVKGEVKHPGTYGIRPGERLSSVLERAGGFQTDAYPYGAVMQRVQVRELEAKAQDQMILRVKDLRTNLELMPETDPKQKQAKEMALQQYQTTLVQLSSTPPLGRVAIRISPNTAHWKNTSSDVEVRAGDTLVVPKRPSYVMVTGQVFNSTAVSYRPGKSAKWYLSQSGGPTQLANKKAIFVIRADGSVIGSRDSVWSGNSLGAVLQPGDTVVVPEKALGGGVNWQNLFVAAQLASSVANTVFIAMHY
jgi:polysaccharide export outer membrane protein